MLARVGEGARVDVYRLLSARQSRARRRASSRAPPSTRQSSTPTACFASRARPGCSSTEPAAMAAIKDGRHSARGRAGADRAAARWARAWKKPISSRRRFATCRSASSVAIVTDARFSGVSTGACIGHVSPEALAGGPIGKLRDGDLIRIVIDRTRSMAPSTSSVTLGSKSVPKVVRRNWRRDRRGPISRPIHSCRPTPGCGRRSRTRAAGLGAAACSTWTRSSPRSSPAERRCAREALAASRTRAARRLRTRHARRPRLAARRRRSLSRHGRRQRPP